MTSTSSDNKRIAKNSIVLYFRMFLMMVISIYTARVVLDVLGIEDYGINNLVGGVVGMLEFLNSSMAGCTQRYISFAIGKKDKDRLSITFSTALLIHILIGCVVVIVAETLGLWFIYNKLVIPENRISAALWTYHLAVSASFISIISVPYNADIIAHEKMSAFAYITIYDALAKLLIVYLLTIIPFDHLKTYALLIFLVQLTDRAIYGRYCSKHFKETKFRLKTDKSLFKDMLSFSGWDLYGNFSVTLRTQGVSMLLNMFFGPVLNAASGVATKVQGVVMGFANNIIVSIRPQIVKSYAKEDYDRFNYLLQRGALFTFLLLMMFTVPLIVECRYVLSIWLVKVPDYTTILCQITLIFNLFADLSVVIMCGIHATGCIKKSSIINGTLYLAVLPLTYLAFKFGYQHPAFPFLINVLAVFIGMSLNVYYLHEYCPRFLYRIFYIKIVLRCVLSFGISLCLLSLISKYLVNESFIRLVLVCTSSVVLTVIIATLSMTMNERRYILNKIKSKVQFRIRNGR